MTELKCPVCEQSLGFQCKECQEEVEVGTSECPICGGEVVLVAYMSDKETEAGCQE